MCKQESPFCFVHRKPANQGEKYNRKIITNWENGKSKICNINKILAFFPIGRKRDLRINFKILLYIFVYIDCYLDKIYSV